MNHEAQRIERLIHMAGRLIEALEADIVVLQAGKPAALRTADPEIQTLSSIYAREAQGFDPSAAKSAPTELRKKLAATVAAFREVLKRHDTLLTAVRNCSEGMVRAIVDEVEKRKTPTRIYGQRPTGRPQARSSLLYNAVI